MPVIVAIKELRYAGKTIQADESFEASEKDAKLLVQIRRARRSNAVAPKALSMPREVRAPVMAKVETAETAEVKTEPLVDDTAPKRHYRRRDMSADQD